VNVSSANKFFVAPTQALPYSIHMHKVLNAKDVCALQVFDSAARVRDRFFAPLD